MERGEGATCCLAVGLPLVISYSEICFCHNFVNDSHVQILRGTSWIQFLLHSLFDLCCCFYYLFTLPPVRGVGCVSIYLKCECVSAYNLHINYITGQN